MIESDAEKLARTAADLARKSAEFQVLQRVSSDINSTLELDEIYDVALRTMGELFEFHHANILLLDPDGNLLATGSWRDGQGPDLLVGAGDDLVGFFAEAGGQRLRRFAGLARPGSQRH